MWTLIFIVSMQSHGVAFTSQNIPGFTTKENCMKQGQLLVNNTYAAYGKSLSPYYQCVEVK